MIRLTASDRIIGVILATLLAINSGCVRALRTEPLAPRGTPWCVTVSLRNGEIGRACGETRATCERTAAAAKRYGSLGGLVSVDECVYDGTEQP
jgi:hypothetical protein